MGAKLLTCSCYHILREILQGSSHNKRLPCSKNGLVLSIRHPEIRLAVLSHRWNDIWLKQLDYITIKDSAEQHVFKYFAAWKGLPGFKMFAVATDADKSRMSLQSN